MAKKKLGYWQERYLKDKAANINASERYINSRLKKYYIEAAKEIEADIHKFYEKYAKTEKITLAEARKRLKEADFHAVDFEKMSKETAALKRKHESDEAPEGVKQQIEEQEKKLNLLSKKGQVSRLEALHTSIDQATLKLYDKTQMTVYDLLKDGYQDGYYKNIYRIQQYVGFGVDFTAVNEAAVKKAVLSKHGKKNFSSTLYKHRKDLSRDLQENLTIGMIRGESVQQMSKRISKRMDVSYSNAKRLVRTETAYVYEQATLDSYLETGVTRYEYLATLDNRTSEICQSLDGKEFYVEDAMPGENFPPMHPNCRSTTVAVFDDDMVTERAARDSSGKYYKVPSDMTYQEWKKEHVYQKEQYGSKAVLSQNEIHALNEYKGFFSYIINEKLRNGFKLTIAEENIVDVLDQALDKFSNYQGTVTRSLTFADNSSLQDFLDAHEINGKVVYPSYTSTTAGREFYNPEGQVQIYIENSTKGKNLTTFNSAEKEVLYKRGQEFVVLNKVKQGNVWYILLEEH